MSYWSYLCLVFNDICISACLQVSKIQKQERKTNLITLLGAIFSKTVMEYHGKKQIVSQPTSNKPYSNVPRPCDFQLCYSQVRGLPPLLFLIYLYRESRSYTVLTRDKCFIQMWLSHIVEEVMNSRAPAGPVHRVKPAQGGTRLQQQN